RPRRWRRAGAPRRPALTRASRGRRRGDAAAALAGRPPRAQARDGPRAAARRGRRQRCARPSARPIRRWMFENARSLLERGFRRSAMWAYALNQSRAKVVMDPIYLAVARALLRGHGPSEALMRDRFPSNLFFPYRAASRKLQYFVEDWDWSEARPELLTPRQRQMMHTVALGETSGSAVADGFLRAFRTNPELAAFFGLWFTEELNHFIGYHLYLRKMGEAWPAERGLQVAETEVLPYADDPMEIAACNMYQELLGFLIYR